MASADTGAAHAVYRIAAARIVRIFLPFVRIRRLALVYRKQESLRWRPSLLAAETGSPRESRAYRPIATFVRSTTALGYVSTRRSRSVISVPVTGLTSMWILAASA